MSRRFTVTALPRHGPTADRGPDRGAGGGRLPGRDGRGERPGTAGGAGAGGEWGEGCCSVGQGPWEAPWGRVPGAGSVWRGLWGRAGRAEAVEQSVRRVCRARRGGGGAEFPRQGPWGGSVGQSRRGTVGVVESPRDGGYSAGPLGGRGDPWSRAGVGRGGGAEHRAGLSCLGRSPHPRAVPRGCPGSLGSSPALSPSQGLSEQGLTPAGLAVEWSRDCGRLWGARLHTASWGAMEEGGLWAREGMGRAGCGQPAAVVTHRTAVGAGAGAGRPSPHGAWGTWQQGCAVTGAVSIPENRPTAAPCCVEL